MKFTKIFYALFFCLVSFRAESSSILAPAENVSSKPVTITSFQNYFPFSKAKLFSGGGGTVITIFDKALETALPQKNYRLDYKVFPDTDQAVSAVRQGDVDIFLGAYYSTKLFEGLEYIFPAVINNPIYLMTTPDKISNITNVQDLKKYKGIYVQNEYFSDYMITNFKNNNLSPVQTSDEAFKLLLTGEVDFMLGSYYFEYVEVVRLGLKPYIAFSNDPLWNMPLFIAMSKTKSDLATKAIQTRLHKAALSETFKSQIAETLKETVEEFERNSQGVVPPMYVRQPLENELTPADERKEEN